MKKLILGALLAALTTSAALGFGGHGVGFSKLGAGFGRSGGGGRATCSNTTNYTQSCNLRFLFIQPL